MVFSIYYATQILEILWSISNREKNLNKVSTRVSSRLFSCQFYTDQYKQWKIWKIFVFGRVADGMAFKAYSLQL